MRRRTVLKTGAAMAGTALAGGGLSRPAIAQPAKVLKFIPHANLSSPDPVWTTTAVAFNHGNLVWDRLYALTEKLESKPQMLAGDEVSSDGLTWKMTLRDGLMFHDGEPVRARDCVASLQRWARRDGFGQRLTSQLDEMIAQDDKTIVIRLKKPYPVMRFAIAQGSSFIMPERIAKTDAFQQINEFIGSGPFRFIRNEWVSGSSAGYAKFDKYVPRQEAPDSWAGGKVAHFDKIEWKVVPDAATAAAALQTGEVDWLDLPLFDLVPQLRKNQNVRVSVFDPLGWIAIVALNHLHPPFNNPAIRRALIGAINQQDVIDAVLGEVKEFGQVGAGFFTTNTPNASTAGLEKILGPRNIAAVRKAIQDAGYKGEKVVLMSPSDLPALQTIAQVAEAMFKSVGLNVEYLSMDWGSLVTRRANQEPPEKGGWNAFTTTWTGTTFLNPGNHFPLRGVGTKGGWFGWATDEKMEGLREKWFDAANPAEEKAICEQMQLLAFENVPFLPMAHWFYPTAYRSNLTDFPKAALPIFWGVKRV
ncbi:MAG: ABC transporter substrate-binding protein [Alphaproteobacteria bacterium]|nr:ABC transporter substrate-binding protein [Alphaproteobacteria bacterium]